MREHHITSHFTEFDQIDELLADDRGLLEAAIDASGSAYAPYSGFRVGAAVLLENGVIVCGNNQENAAYPSGMCAERVAMFAASSQFPGLAFTAVAIYACSDRISVEDVVTPCGSCRQVMAEYDNARGKAFRIILKGEKSSIYIFEGIGELLPLKFSSKHLKA